MTELQVKAKKGSLKKFFAMFLAVCVCMTTFQLNGMFASAEENTSDITPEIAIKNKVITAENATTVNLNERAGAVVTPENATIDWTTSDAKVTISGGVVSPGDATDFEVEITGIVKSGTKTAEDTLKVQFGKAGGSDPVIPVTGVSLDETTLTLKKGETKTLTATVSPGNATNKDVTWSSSDDKVATVDSNGKVAAVAKGTATITVTTKDSNKTATCAVEVTDDGGSKDVPVTGVELNKSTLSLTVGGSETLTATVKPATATNKEVIWKSSDTSVASVVNGKVTAVKAGKATITVTTKDGNKTATCAVTVNAASSKVNVTGVSLNKTNLTLTVGGSETLTATVNPANATDKTITWKSSDEKIASVVNGKVTAVKAGKATITVTTKDGNKTATCAVTVNAAPIKVKKVELSAKKLYVVAKKSVTVGVSVQPSDAKNKAVTWKSKNTKVATVNSKGKITAKNAAGKNTKITATAKDGSKKSATVTVYVVKKAVKVSSVKLPKTAKVDVKGTVALKTTIKPAKATMDSKTLKWTTSDKKVATVANGVVTGKKAGVATITVKAGKKSAKCVVTVTKKGVKATLKPAKATIKVKQKYQIKLKGKGDKITSCKSSNTKVATVTKSGKITGKKAGKADITVVTKKGGVATFKVTVKKK